MVFMLDLVMCSGLCIMLNMWFVDPQTTPTFVRFGGLWQGVLDCNAFANIQLDAAAWFLEIWYN
jgi:hypothetical protein